MMLDHVIVSYVQNTNNGPVSPPPPPSPSSVGAIVGGVVGGIVGICAIAAIAACWLRRPKAVFKARGSDKSSFPRHHKSEVPHQNLESDFACRLQTCYNFFILCQGQYNLLLHNQSDFRNFSYSLDIKATIFYRPQRHV